MKRNIDALKLAGLLKEDEGYHMDKKYGIERDSQGFPINSKPGHYLDGTPHGSPLEKAMEIKANWNAHCEETGLSIVRGERCIYIPGRKAVFKDTAPKAREILIRNLVRNNNPIPDWLALPSQ